MKHIKLFEDYSLIVEARKNIKRLPESAPIQAKISMWELISHRAYTEYHSKKFSEYWTERIYNKYRNKWEELYDQIKDTPEFKEYCKKNNIAIRLQFGDMLA